MDVEYYIMTVGECIIACLAVITNGYVLLLIGRFTALRTTTNCFVASLATADLLVGAVGIPCALVAYNGLPHNSFYGCLIVNSMIVILTQISIFGLLAVAVERYMAIKHPFTYKEHWTGRFALVVIAGTWLAAILVGLVPLFGWNLGPSRGETCKFTQVISMAYMVYFSFFCCVLLPLCIILAIYIYIYSVVRNALRQVASLRIGAVDAHKDRMAQDIRAAKWFAVVIFLFAISWLPIHIMNATTLFAGPTSSPALTAAILLSHFNSACNPILYALGNHQFQLAGRKLLGRPSPGDDYNSAYSAGPLAQNARNQDIPAIDHSLSSQNGVTNPAFNPTGSTTSNPAVI